MEDSQEQHVQDAQLNDTSEKATPDSTKTKMSTLQIGLLMFALCCSTFLAALDITIVTTALPTISNHFHSSSAYVWVGAAYMLADGASTPIWGKVSDIWGRKPILLVAIAIFFLGSAISATAVSMDMLIAGRAVQGLGGGGLLTLSNIVISDLFSMRDRAQYYGYLGMVWAIACSVGPLLGGALSEKASWRWCFYINLPCTAVVFTIVCFYLNLKTPKTHLLAGLKALDWLGCLTIVGATVMLLLGLNFGGSAFPWSSPTVICLIVFGALAFPLFLLIEYKVAVSPIIPFGIFNTWDRLGPLLACLLHGFVLTISSYFLPLYFQSVLGASSLLSGVYLLPMAVAMSFSAALTGWAISATGKYAIFMRGGFVLMLLGSGLLIILPDNRSFAQIIIFQILVGAGIGPNFQAILVALQTAVKVSDSGTATAAFGFARNLATSIGLVVAEVVFQQSMNKRYTFLAASLGPKLAGTLADGGAEASVFVVDKLPTAQRTVARNAYSSSLRNVWITQTTFAAAALCVICFIRSKHLSKDHEVVETGLEVEARRAEEAKRDHKGGGGVEEDKV